jgi:hypothetical protein
MFQLWGKSMSEWLYQIRIKVTKNISEDLRSKQKQSLSKKLKKIADTYNMILVCTFDAFKEYCDEAEKYGIEKYGYIIGLNQQLKTH